MMTDYEHMIVSAMRYAIGRRTYIVELTVNYIIAKLPKLSDYRKGIMIKDIESATSYGDDCDKQEWIKLLKELKDADGKQTSRNAENI